ncbi:MAG: hypothetical protein A3J93_02215 [Candidatus Magasanikbacteria bacterium RIFOXYC2_FULL_42_28]|uniref:Uncharacterized protein n=1 Tax=Candidatus Magasanikbacteria bacterium RIFOXYC2_FULL_42_28 TaxID=1798704 RepID=A0A1F6NVX8_9BACT|nr:MAG: hypothetical protein A3J93_02215 [Candidatus Magasanikbacteria bacterium RIFOXYC2_FULL_42_28]
MPKKGGKKNNKIKTEVKQPKETATEQLARLRALAESRSQAKNWFYLAVGALATIILLFWGYSMYNQLTSFEFQKTDENKLLNENKKTWKEIFETVGSKDSTGEIKTKLQTILTELKKAAETTATTTATTTISMATTTPDIASATTTTATPILSSTTTTNNQ